MAKIEMYSKDPCPYCVRAKNFFNETGIEFTEYDMTDRWEEMESIKTKYGWRTVPLILVNDKLIGGYNDLMNLVNEGKWTELIKD